MLASVACSQNTPVDSPPLETGVSHTLAKWRAAHYSDVRYKLNLTLEKMSPVLKGTMEIRVNVSVPPAVAGGLTQPTLNSIKSDSGAFGGPNDQLQPPATAGGSDLAIILDWRRIAGHEKDSTISNVSINGKSMDVRGGGAFEITDTKPYIIEDREHLIFGEGVVAGENVIKLDFTSPILTSGSAITRYIDKEDGAEYLYSLFVPSDASTAFPVFDQPDLKARFTLTDFRIPPEWKVVSNAPDKIGIEEYPSCARPALCPQRINFYETKPISTYVFAFAAGPWAQVSVPPAVAGGLTQPATTLNTRGQPPATAGGTDPTRSIFVRKSQLAKYQPHAAEVARLRDAAVSYLETYFDYKFPFPKYDIVLIPEFPFGGMEHAGATFLRESSVIFPTEPTANDQISRANVIFHETAHQWFGDTVTMKWFDDLWLKEGFAEFMAYKTLEKVLPQYNAWKVFYERNKQAAYLTDSTKGTTPIYQEIDNLSSAKSAYGNIVYRKAPSFLRQAEFYLGEDKFQTAVRSFLKKHEYANAGWEDLVKEFEATSGQDLKEWARQWVKQRGLPIYRVERTHDDPNTYAIAIKPEDALHSGSVWQMKVKVSAVTSEKNGNFSTNALLPASNSRMETFTMSETITDGTQTLYYFFPNYQDYGYGIFVLDDKSRDYVLKNIQNEKDDFLRAMMWGSLWDSVREGELDPKDYVELVIKNLSVPSASFSLSNAGSKQAEACTLNCGEQDESTIATLLGRVSTAMNYYMSVPPAVAGRLTQPASSLKKSGAHKSAVSNTTLQPPATAGGTDLRVRLENVLLDRLQNAPTPGQRITFYRAFLGTASTERSRSALKQMLSQSAPPAAAGGTGGKGAALPLRTKDKFDIVTRLAILGDPDAPRLLAALEKTETGDDAKRYAYAAHAAFGTAENKAKFWNDFLTNKEISESWIEAAMGPFNSIRHADLTQQYLTLALAELPNLKRSRKIFFVNGWLGAFIGGQRDEKALAIVNKFLADNPNLDNDLRLKILENVDTIERAVKIRNKYK